MKTARCRNCGWEGSECDLEDCSGRTTCACPRCGGRPEISPKEFERLDRFLKKAWDTPKDKVE